MDSYLASLVAKETATEEVPAPAEPVVEEVAKEVVQADPEEPVVEEAPAEEVEEEVVVEEEETKVPDSESEEKQPEPEVSKPEPKPEKQVNLKAADIPSQPHKEGDTIYLKETIRVYRTPDASQVARGVSGSVIYKGKIGEFTIVQYMRHGFGLVIGYTLDAI